MATQEEILAAIAEVKTDFDAIITSLTNIAADIDDLKGKLPNMDSDQVLAALNELQATANSARDTAASTADKWPETP